MNSNLKEYKSILFLTGLIGFLCFGCRKTNLEGMYKFYDGESIGDFLFFEEQSHYLENDTIYFEDEPVGIIISTKKRFDG